MGRVGTGQDFEILPRDGPGRDFDSLSCPVRVRDTGQKKKNRKNNNDNRTPLGNPELQPYDVSPALNNDQNLPICTL